MFTVKSITSKLMIRHQPRIASPISWIEGNTQMRVLFDKSLCAAHGDCVVAAPAVFDLGDDDEVAVVLDENPSEDQRGNVEMAVKVCPVGAIRIEG